MSDARPARPNPLRAFRHRAYVAVWIGAFVSNVGTWMEAIAVGIYVTETTGKAGWTGTVAALVYVPAVIIGPIGGALADRFERRRYLAIVTCTQIVFAATIATLSWTHHLSVPALSILMTLTGCAATLLGPAFSALLATIVPREDLLSATTLNSAQFNLARVLGPTFAAAAIAVGGISWAFALNAVSFLAVLVALVVVRIPQSALIERKQEPLLRGIRSGIRAARSDPGIRTALTLTLVTSLLISPFIGLVPAFAITVLHDGAAATSMLVASQGLGAIVSAIASSAYADYFGRRRLLEGASLAIGLVAAVYWASPSFAFAMPAIFVLGALYLSVITGSSTICLDRAPVALQARVSSLFSMVLGGGYAMGLVGMGWLGDRFGLRAVTIGGAALFVAVIGAARLASRELFAGVEAPRAS